MKKIINNISWLFFDKIIRIIGGLLIGIWVARYLGPSDFGVLNYALAYTSFFIIFVKLGLDQIIIREITKKEKLTNYLLGTAFWLKILGSSIAILFVGISLLFIDANETTKIVIFIISIGFVFQSVDVIDYFYQSKILSKFVIIARNSAFILSSFLKVYFILYEYDVMYFAVAIVAEILLSGIFLIIIYKKTSKYRKKWKYSSKVAVRLLKYSWPLAISSFLIAIHLKIDQVMLGNMLNMEEVGIYSVAVKLSEVWYFFPAIIVSTLFPYFVNLRINNQNEYIKKLKLLYFAMFWSGAFVGLIFIIYGDLLISFLFGEEYKASYDALIFNVWAGIFVAQSYAKGIWVISENLQIFRIYNNLIAIIANISLNLYLIPLYGISGAAMATLLSRLINNWMTPLLWKPLRENTIVSIKSINPFYVYRECLRRE